MFIHLIKKKENSTSYIYAVETYNPFMVQHHGSNGLISGIAWDEAPRLRDHARARALTHVYSR